MSTRTAQHTYTIKEAAVLTGLPASTLRYYESIGVIAPISRGASSKHRVYDEDDLDQLMWVACLAATGMSVSDMRQYVTNGELGPSAAGAQIELLEAQQQRLALEAEYIALRQRYVRLKIDYWHAVDAGDTARAELLSSEARKLADELKRAKQQ
ncbi:MerR family transcriptional regulator [Nocardioides sp. WL0053]|uniref:MerR family transcriptional regulator n=1 Tax=Nocardioides jiangsuensis TaxID=2866161 RepID=A0ABS7REB8_9ACTN|nr:MerR family transcriptional regulator [Nocardioides jiangsuensis]MBY9073370.1 MerR family transcriptional regulator [Nocardioides jiangsuensis]